MMIWKTNFDDDLDGIYYLFIGHNFKYLELIFYRLSVKLTTKENYFPRVSKLIFFFLHQVEKIRRATYV